MGLKQKSAFFYNLNVKCLSRCSLFPFFTRSVLVIVITAGYQAVRIIEIRDGRDLLGHLAHALANAGCFLQYRFLCS